MAIAMRLRNQLQAVYKMDPLRNEARGRTGRAGGTGRRRWRRHRGPARAGTGGAAVGAAGGRCETEGRCGRAWPREGGVANVGTGTEPGVSPDPPEKHFLTQ